MITELVGKALLAADRNDMGDRNAEKKEKMRAVLQALARDMVKENADLAFTPVMYFNSDESQFAPSNLNSSITN